MTTSILGANSVLCCSTPVVAARTVRFASVRATSQQSSPPAFRFSGKFDVRRSTRRVQRRSSSTGWGGNNAQVEPLDLTEENVEQVLLDARSEVRNFIQNLNFFKPNIDIIGTDFYFFCGGAVVAVI